MDIYLLVVVIILAFLMIGLSIFLIKYYSNKEETGFGAAIMTKVVAVLYLLGHRNISGIPTSSTAPTRCC